MILHHPNTSTACACHFEHYDPSVSDHSLRGEKFAREKHDTLIIAFLDACEPRIAVLRCASSTGISLTMISQVVQAGDHWYNESLSQLPGVVLPSLANSLASRSPVHGTASGIVQSTLPGRFVAAVRAQCLRRRLMLDLPPCSCDLTAPECWHLASNNLTAMKCPCH